MGIVSYALMAYGLTAVISLAVIGIILGLNKFMARFPEEVEEDD